VVCLSFAAMSFDSVRHHDIWTFVLAGEPVRFDESLQPHFTEQQLKNSSEATRAGLITWAKTGHGQMLIERFSGSEYQINVIEDDSESGIGRAPQPGMAVLLAADNHSKMKCYDLILNPDYFRIPKDLTPIALGQPTSAADAMAVAWAGEMLHIYFYSRGISLPHHQRSDFQEEWRSIAEELGYPTLRHEDDEHQRRPEITVWR
jgi:hypothetical protein